MDSKPVTLAVKIYDRVYNIRYPSEQRVIELMREFATQCKGSKKPGTARRFFVCIHCGKSDFGNKLMLNVHRFEVGCEAALYSDGTKALLLPYPDFLPGQGKMVEVMGKHGGGRVAGKKRPKGATTGEEGGDDAGEEDGTAEETQWAAEFEGPPPSKRLNSSVTHGDGYDVRSRVSPAEDLFYGAAPPKTDKAAPKPRKSKRNVEDSVDGDTVKGTGGKQENPVLPKRVTQTGGTGRGLMKILAKMATEGGPSDEPAEGGPSGEEHARSGEGGHIAERRGLQNQETMKKNKKRKTDGDGAATQDKTFAPNQAATVHAGPRLHSPPVSRRAQSRDVVHPDTSTPDAKAEQKFHVRARDQPKQQRELRLPTKSRYPVSVWAEDMKRIASKDVKTLEETFVLAASLGAMRALREKCSSGPLSNPSVSLKPSPAAVVFDQVSRGTVLEGKCVINADGLKDVEDGGDEESDHEQGYFDDHRDWGVPVGDTGEGIDPMEVRKADMTLEAAVEGIRIWDDTDQTTLELLQHWAHAKGFPRPFQYQREMENKFQAREEELQRHERLYVAEEQRRADEALAALTIPTAPEKPPMPGLYHLQKFEGAVAVPWSWDHESGDSFRRAWEDSYSSREFQDQLMGCLWWWTSKKADRNLHEDIKAVRHSISAAMDLLVASRGANEPYPELEKVCAYLQWTRDYATFLETSRDYIKTKKAEINAKVSGAREDFREKNAMLREKIIWEWCPIWRVLIDHKDIFDRLPALPWRHDRHESQIVRRSLTQQRVERRKPSPLVQVFKLLFLQEYGIHRQTTCPVHGLSRSIIRGSCLHDTGIRKALSTLVTQGPYLFADLEDTGSALDRRITLEITQIKEGRGDAVVDGVMEWVRGVQIRALQDHAAEHPQWFDEAWGTRHYWEWDSQSKHWGKTLQNREDRDIGWVPSMSTPAWSCGVAQLRAEILKVTRDIGVALEVEDREQWVSCVGAGIAEDPKESAIQGDRAKSHGDAMALLEAASVLVEVEGKGCDTVLNGSRDSDDGFDRPMGKADMVQVIQGETIQLEDQVAVSSRQIEGEQKDSQISLPSKIVASVTELLQKSPSTKGGSLAEGGGLEEDPYGEVSPLKSGALAIRAADMIQSLLRQNTGTQSVTLPAEDVGTAGSRTGEEGCEEANAGIFPEIMAAMQEESIPPDPEPLMTVTQVVKGASDMDDIPPQESQFVFSLSQWMPESSTSLTSKTPPRGAMLESGSSTGVAHSSGGPDSTAKNLATAFDQEVDLDTVQQLVRLSQPCPGTSLRNDISEKEPGPSPQLGSHPEGTFNPDSEDCAIVDASCFSKLSLPQVYEDLGLDALLKAVPTLGEGSSRNPGTVFFNQNGKEVEVGDKAIRDLTKAKSRLGNDVVDFVLSRIYMAYPQQLRHEIHIVSSRVCSLLEAVMAGTKSIQRLAKDYFQPPPGVEINQVKDIIIPWVCDGHWSVLVFQHHRVFHLDSCEGIVHFPKDKHSEFVRWMSAAWQCLRGVEDYPVPDLIPISVFQQLGNNECGHLCIRNIMLYLKFRARDTTTGGVQLLGQYLKPHTAVQMNKEMMVLFAQELDPLRRDLRYTAPFCQLGSRSALDGDDDGLLMDGAPPPAPKKPRVTRASQRALALDASSDDS